MKPYNVMSGDVWWLSVFAARQIAIQKYGVSEESFDKLIVKLEKARKNKGKENPLHSMF